MREKRLAERFEQALAGLARSQEASEEPGPDFLGRLHLAGRLAGLDLARESRIRESLGERLASALEERRALSTARPRRQPWSTGRPVLATAVGVALAILVLAAFAPGSLAALVEPVVRVIESLRVGKHTRLVRSSPRTAAEVRVILARARQQLATGQRWSLRTEYGGFGGRVPPGQRPIVQRVTSLEVLRSLTTLPLQGPTCLHRGHAVRFDHALVPPAGPALLFFGSGRDELLLALFPVGKASVAWERSVMRQTPDGGLVTESPESKAEELSLDGRTVVWDPDTTGLSPDSSALRWEADGASYSLMGRSLTREEAVELFLSLQRLASQE